MTEKRRPSRQPDRIWPAGEYTLVVEAAREEIRRSLDRMGVDHVDLWQVHVWTDETPVEETMTALDLAVGSGRAAYVVKI